MKHWQVIVICVIYFSCCLIGISYHELWLDEAHHILLGRDSHSLSELIYNSRYEGHPLLWNVILYMIMHSLDSLIFVQIFHILLATGCVYLILKHAPFSVVVKILIVFGYFMIYEYSIITRHYALALLLILLFLTEYSSSNKRIIILSMLLALLCNVHVFSAMIAFGLALATYNDWKNSTPLVRIFSFLILVFGVAIFLIHIIPPQDHFLNDYNQENMLSLKRFTRIVWIPVKGMLPLPDLFEMNYWNTNLIARASKFLALLLSLIIFITPGIIFKNNRKAFFLFYGPSFGIMLFFYFTPLMLTTRNCGYLSILFLTAYWFNYIFPQTTISSKNGTSEIMSKRISFGFVTCVLITQFVSGLILFFLDLSKDFSNSKRAGAYINYHINSTAKILVSHQSAGPALACYVDHPLIYLETETQGTFCLWNNSPFMNSDSLLLRKIQRQIIDVKEVYLILNTTHKMDDLQSVNGKMRILEKFPHFEMANFSGAVVSSENYYVYKIK